MKKSLLFSKKTIKKIHISIDNYAQIYVRENQLVEKGDILYVVKKNKISEQIDIAKELDIKKEKCKDYLQIIDGQFLDPNTVIAEKVNKSGMYLKRIFPQFSGLASLERIKEGVVEIQDVEDDIVTVSNFNGKISSVKNGVGIGISVNAITIKALANNFSRDYVESDLLDLKKEGMTGYLGELYIIEDGTGVYTEKNIKNVDLKGRIVFAGKYLYKKLADKLIELGASAIITHSMDYNDFLACKIKIVVLGGFGHLQQSKNWKSIVSDMSGKSIYLAQNNNEITVIDGDLQLRHYFEGSKTVPIFTQELEEGNILILRNADNFGNIVETKKEPDEKFFYMEEGDVEKHYLEELTYEKLLVK